MPHSTLPCRSVSPWRPVRRRLGTVALAAILGAAALPAVDAAAAAGTAGTAPQSASYSRIPGMQVVKTHFTAIKRHDVAIPKHGSGSHLAVTASDGSIDSLVAAPPDGPARSTWVVNYDAGFTTAATGPQAQAAFQAAVDIWSRIVYSPVTIVVNASYADLGGNTLGQAAAAEGFHCVCLGDGVHTYPVALANALYGSDIDTSNPDIVAQFNSNPVAPFYYGTDGAPTSGTVDFESVVLHELGHGLGFAGSMSMANGATAVTYSNPAMKWDTFLVDGNGSSIVDNDASGSTQLTTAMESPLYWNGTNGISANGASDPVMYAPASWQQGSSGGAHLDEATYPAGNANSLMTPQIGAQEAVHSPGAVAVAMLHDIGWTASLPTASAPSAPTGVTATSGDGSATVSWSASDGFGNAVTGYTATAAPGGATCTTTGTLSCTVSGLTNGTSYTFTVTATNSIGTGSASTASSAVVPAGKPATPAAPIAAPNNGGATVSWTAPSANGSAITGYDVESSADNGTTWSSGLTSALTSTATQATFTGLSSGTSYVFQVAAINAIGEGAMSPASSAVTPAATPGPPTGVQATRGDTQASVSWTAPSDTGGSAISGYRLEWSSDNGTTWSQPLASALTSTTAAATVTELTNGTPYVFHVAAINSVGTGAFSTSSSATTPAGKPGAPTNVTGTAGDGQVTVSWTAPSSNGDPITGYDVEYSTDGTTWSSAWSSALTSTATSAVVSSLTNGQAYHFRVAAINGVGTGTATTAGSTVTPASVPGAPTSVSATRGDSQATLSWTAPADNGGSAVTSYAVRVSTDGGTSWTALGPAPGSPALIGGLTNGQAYVFDVAATNSAGTGAFSAASNSVTPATTPGAPTQVAGTTGDGQISVGWTAPSSNGGAAVTGYDVEWSSDSGKTWSAPLASAQSSTSTVALVTGLANGTPYVFRVAAINGVGTGSFSVTSPAVTPAGTPATPSDIGASAGDQSVSVSWTAPSDGGSPITSYDVRYSTDGGTTWTSAGVAYTSSPAVVSGLANGTSYVFDVAAINGVGASSYSTASPAAVPSGVPGTPTGVGASAGNATATVSWTAPSANGAAITGYDVRYSSDNGAHWTSAGVVYSAGPATVTGLTNGTPYVFDVAASNANGSGSYSSASTAVTPSTTPGIPVFATLTSGDGTVSLTWTAPATGGAAISGYDVEWSTDDGTTWSTPLASATSSPAASATVTGLTNGTPYVFRIAAINGNGTGDFSDASAAVTPAGVPDAPTAVTATRDDGSASVSWTAPADNGATISAYEVRYSTDDGTTWTSFGAAFASSPVDVTGLANGTAYVFDVAASNSAGQSAFSSSSDAVTPATFPDQPTDVTGSSGDGQVSLSWTGPSSDGGATVTGYDVEWSSDDGTTWSDPLASAQSSTDTVALVTGLTNGTGYVFRVAAINDVGAGSFSASSDSVTPATTPDMPTAVSATAGDQSASVSWTAPADGGSPITSYDVQYSSDDGTTWTSAGVAYAASPALVTGLTNGTSYEFDVVAINGVGAGSPSDPSSSVVPAGVPASPDSVTATRGDSLATVAWGTPDANGSPITSYVVQYSTDGGTQWTAVPGSFDGSPATVTGLTNGTPYVFEVAAVNGVGTGAYSAMSSAVTPATTPQAPTDVAGTSGPGQVSVAWQPNADDGGSPVTSFTVRYSSDDGATWTTVDAPADASPALVDGLSNGTPYVFEVAATNDVGSSAYSDASAPVTPAAVPDAPTVSSVDRGDGQATLSWNEPAANGSPITSYVVQYSTDGGTQWTAAPGSFDASPATVTGLTNGTPYVFEVAAVNGVGAGAYSALSDAVTPATIPDAPANVTVARDGDGSAAVTWSAPADGGDPITGYVLEWSTDGGTTWSAPLDSALSDPATAASVTGLTDGTSYRFQVAAINSVGTGAFSDVSGAVTPATVPGVPTGVSALAGDGQATVWWQPPVDGGSAITSYDVRYSADGGTTWTSADVAFRESPATVTGLTNGTSYVFDVAALNDVGVGDYSTATGAVTPTRDSTSLTRGATTTIPYGATLVVSTVLRDTATGATMGGYAVQLLSRTSTTKPWTLVKTVTTSWVGGASVSVRPGVATMYMWKFAGVPGHAATQTTAQTVGVAQTVSVGVTASTVVHYAVTKFYGTVAPNEANQYVYLQILVGRSWRTTAVKAKLVRQRLPNGRTMVGYVLALKTNSKGTFSYRVYRPATAVNSAGLSKVVKIRVV